MVGVTGALLDVVNGRSDRIGGSFAGLTCEISN